MRSLSEAVAGTLLRLEEAETSARMLLSELDSLDTRLHRAYAAVCIDSVARRLDAERNRMLEAEKRAEIAAGVAKLPALGIYGLVSFSVSRRPNWRAAASSILREEPFGDIRVAVHLDDLKIVNVSGMARARGTTVSQIIAIAEQEGFRVLTWPEFAVDALNLRRASLRGYTAVT